VRGGFGFWARKKGRVGGGKKGWGNCREAGVGVKRENYIIYLNLIFIITDNINFKKIENYLSP
jgi:hypothetical protein